MMIDEYIYTRYLQDIAEEVDESRQSSAAYISLCFNLNILESYLDGW